MDRREEVCKCPQLGVSVEAKPLSSPGIMYHLGKKGCLSITQVLMQQLDNPSSLPALLPLRPVARASLFTRDVDHFMHHLCYHPEIEKQTKILPNFTKLINGADGFILSSGQMFKQIFFFSNRYILILTKALAFLFFFSLQCFMAHTD